MAARSRRSPIPILASCHKDDPLQLDRVILKRVELLPHASFTLVEEHVGLKGEKLHRLRAPGRQAHRRDRRQRLSAAHPSRRLRHARRIVRDEARAARRLSRRVREAAAPYELLVESPIIARTQDEQIESFREVRAALAAQGASRSG